MIQKEILADRVLILPDEQSKTTGSGLVRPQIAQERPVTGKVILVGAGMPDAPMTVKPGDDVLYHKQYGTPVDHGGKIHLIMRESEIISIIEK